MTDVVIVTAPFTYTPSPSLAPALLKACVEQEGLSAKAWDLSAEFNHHYRSHANYWSVVSWFDQTNLRPEESVVGWYLDIVEDYAKRLISLNPRYVAISVLTHNSQRFTEDLSFFLRKHGSHIKIIIGGSGIDNYRYEFNKLWYQLMLDAQLADAALIGEGEFAIARIIKNNLTGHIVEPQLTNEQLENIPIPNYDDYDWLFYKGKKKTYWGKDINTSAMPSFWITASKGCVKKCTFCDVAKLWPKYRFRKGKDVAEEIITLNRKYGATTFGFTDSLINGGMKTFYDMNVELAARLPKTIKYEGQMICRGKRDMPEHHFELMSQAGCYSVNIGIESGSERVRNHMKKGSTNEDIHYTTEMLCKYGIYQKWNIIAGYPTETDEDWQQTLDLVQYWLPRSKGYIKIVPIGLMAVLPGTPLTEEEVHKDLGLDIEKIHGFDFAWTTTVNPNNTMDRRAKHFLDFCNWLIDYDATEYRDHLHGIMTTVQKQLDWYNEHKAQSPNNAKTS